MECINLHLFRMEEIEVAFSIEMAGERIFNAKTKEYFREVTSSYYNGNYRSAVVMLYSVVISDLIYKLLDLKELYQDSSAEAILTEIEILQKRNPTSPEWETKLIEQINTRTKLLEVADYQNILNLQKHRHLSAHPVLDQEYELYNPNKETTRAHIRNMLEGLFLKPPVLANRITEVFTEDLTRIRDVLIENEEALKQYLNSKYLNAMHPQMQDKLFKTLWKFIFRLTEVECNENRRINFKALKIIFLRRKADLIKLIQSDAAYFSQISTGEPLEYLNYFLSIHGELYSVLNIDARILLQEYITQDKDCNIIAWYINGDVQKHIEGIMDSFESEPYIPHSQYLEYLYDIACEHGCENKMIDLFILLFGDSGSYDTADSQYTSFIKPYLQRYTRENFIKLLEAINTRPQIYNRGRSRTDDSEIMNYTERVLGPDFDYSSYSHFKLTS